MEDWLKILQVSKTIKQKQQEDVERITSEYGIQLFYMMGKEKEQ